MANEIIVFVTTGSVEEARKIARALVTEKLAACANIVERVESAFFWQGKMSHENETLMMIKSTIARLEALTKRVKALHSYSVPEVIALPIIGGSREYLDWLNTETESGNQGPDGIVT